jgi:hypothetical protein
VFIETVIIAAVVAVGLIVGVRAIRIGREMSRRASHHLVTQTGSSPVPPTVDLRPPE